MLKRVLSALTALALLLCGASALADTPNDIFPLDYDTLLEPIAGQHHYILMCVDNWEGNARNLGNTDGVIMATFDLAAHRLLFTTFTREMLVKRPDGGIGRFTYIAKNYGVEETLKIISTHFGVKVQKYIVFSMDNVQKIIDAMGGVYITVTNAEADYLNRYLIARDATTPSMDRAGTYLFSGHAAVIYLRIRKVGGDGDAGRTRRIRTVLTTLTNKYDTISLDDALKLLTAVTDNTVTTNMTLADMMEGIGYAMELRGVSPEGIQMPQDDAMTPITYAGMSTRQVDFEKSREELQAFLRSDNYEVTE